MNPTALIPLEIMHRLSCRNLRRFLGLLALLVLQLMGLYSNSQHKNISVVFNRLKSVTLILKRAFGGPFANIKAIYFPIIKRYR